MADFPRHDKRFGSARRLAAAGLGLSLLAIAGCQTVPPARSGALAAGPVVAAEAAPADAASYRIVPELSDVRFLVYRAGPLARLGHNHVIQAKNPRGEIRLADDMRRSSFAVELTVGDFVVDAESARADEGQDFVPQPDSDAIAGTAANMLGAKVLDAGKYPTISIKSIGANGPAWGMDLALGITLHGMTRKMTVPTAIERSGDTLVATAFFAIKQTDFGITPMSVLGGGLQVEDSVRIRLRLVARKAAAR